MRVEAELELGDEPLSPSRHWDDSPVLIALVAILVGALWLGFVATPRAPADGSPEAGFARDMMVHHAQAVGMAGTVRDRSTNPVIRSIALDLALTQQAQIGQLQGWLDQWGLDSTGSQARMAWMGHPVSGLMPGLATPSQMRGLDTLPPDEADVLFLRLMIPHHQAAIQMAQAVLSLTDRSEVRRFAEGVIQAQRTEIDQMRQLLRDLGADPVTGTLRIPTSLEGHGGHGGGFAGSLAPALRAAVRFAPLIAALFAGAWLGIDAWRRRRIWSGRLDGVDVPRRSLLLLAVAALLGSGLLHAGLAPEHFRSATAYGVFFSASSGGLAILAASVLAWPGRATYAAAGLALLGLIALFFLFRIVAPPGSSGPEELDLVGLLTKAVEAAGVAGCWVLWRGARRPTAEPAT